MENPKLLNKADKILKMLDDLHENNPDEYDKFIKKTLEEGKSEVVESSFRFSIHAKEIKTNKKRFINVCSFPAIPAPKSDEDPISVYGGTTIDEDLDKESVTIEFLGISPKVLDEIGDDKELKKMLIKLAIDYYNDIFHYNLSYDCGLSNKQVGAPHYLFNAFSKQNKNQDLDSKMQPKVNTESPEIKLPFQNIEDDSGNMFDLKLDNKLENTPKLIDVIESSETQDVVFKTDIVSHPKRFVRLKAPIDFIDSVNDIDLEIVGDEIVLMTDSFSESRCKIPCFDKVIEASIKAKFSKSKVLTITIDLLD